MKIYYYNTKDNNFGDELNPWIWNQILPDELFSRDDDCLLIGIGTILNDQIPSSPKKVVLGAGTGYGTLFDVDENTSIYSVRGPLTAERLGLSPETAVIDPAVLVHDLYEQPGEKSFDVSYMPHFSDAIPNGDAWKDICASAGIHYIDPRSPILDVLGDISRSNILLSEAMHGAIVADALRVPWIPIRTKSDILAFKWKDWTASLDMTYRPFTIRRKGSLLNRDNAFRAIVWYATMAQLAFAAKTRSPMLSEEAVLNDRIDTLYRVIDRFVSDHS